MGGIYEEISRIRTEGRKAALAVVVAKEGSAPRGVGTKMIVFEDGRIAGTLGGGPLEEEVIARARDAIARGMPRMDGFSLSGEEGKRLDMLCGGSVTVYIEPIEAEDNLYLVGGGHIARALCSMAKLGDWRVTVIDSSRTHACRRNFPAADALIVDGFAKAVRRLPGKPNEYFVIATRSHREDAEMLPLCMERSPRYVGMIGSREKVRQVISGLRRKGIARSRLRVFHAPMGLDLGGGAPWEIAVAVMGEILTVKYGKSGKALSTEVRKNAHSRRRHIKNR